MGSMSTPILSRAALALVSSLATLALVGASRAARAAPPAVVLAHDGDASALRPVIEAFTARSGVPVTLVGPGESPAHDAASRVRAAKADPALDVVWLADPLAAVALAADGLLDPHDSAASHDWPAGLRDPERRWHGLALRARVLVFHNDHPINIGGAANPVAPSTVRDLYHPVFSKGAFVMARPYAGSARAQSAALFAIWGRLDTRTWAFQLQRQRVRFCRADADAVFAVAHEEALAALADASEARAGQKKGWPIGMLPLRFDKYDARAKVEKPAGPLLVPHAIAKVKGAPNAAGGAALIDFFLSPEGERLLASGDFGFLPVRSEIAHEFPALAVADPASVDWNEIAGQEPEAMSVFREAFPE